MGVETHDRILHPASSMGAVTPRVGDLEGVSDHYSRAFAMEPLESLAAPLRARSLPFRDDGRSVAVTDPWGTAVTVSLPYLTTEELLAR